MPCRICRREPSCTDLKIVCRFTTNHRHSRKVQPRMRNTARLPWGEVEYVLPSNSSMSLGAFSTLFSSKSFPLESTMATRKKSLESLSRRRLFFLLLIPPIAFLLPRHFRGLLLRPTCTYINPHLLTTIIFAGRTLVKISKFIDPIFIDIYIVFLFNSVWQYVNFMFIRIFN